MKKEMTQNAKLLNIAGLTYVLRDVLESTEFDREMKQRTKNYCAYLNLMVERIASHDPEAWGELDRLVNHFYDNLITEEQ
jgi:hypothetical protein